jgi:hypothetical protein
LPREPRRQLLPTLERVDGPYWQVVCRDPSCRRARHGGRRSQTQAEDPLAGQNVSRPAVRRLSNDRLGPVIRGVPPAPIRNDLLARRLIEHGVPFVEVSLGALDNLALGWDTHLNNFDAVQRRPSPAPESQSERARSAVFGRRRCGRERGRRVAPHSREENSRPFVLTAGWRLFAKSF